MRTISTCLRSRSLIIRFFSYQKLTPSELPEVLTLEAEQALHLPAKEICMEWQVLCAPSAGAGDDAPLRGMMMAAPRAAVAAHLRLMQDAGLMSVRVQTACSALNNFYSFYDQGRTRETVCLISLSARTADMVVRAEDGCFARSLFSAESRWEDNRAFLAQNIRNALLYYHLKMKGRPVEKVLLTGRLPASSEWLKLVSEAAGVPAEVLKFGAEPWIQAMPPEPYGWKSCNAAVAIGLALERSGHEPG